MNGAPPAPPPPPGLLPPTTGSNTSSRAPKSGSRRAAASTSTSARSHSAAAPASALTSGDLDLYEDSSIAGREGVLNTRAVDAVHVSRGPRYSATSTPAPRGEVSGPTTASTSGRPWKVGGRLIGKPFSRSLQQRELGSTSAPSEATASSSLGRVQARTKLVREGRLRRGRVRRGRRHASGPARSPGSAP